MDYIKRTAKFGEKLRLMAILGIALLVLVLSFADPAGHSRSGHREDAGHHQK